MTAGPGDCSAEFWPGWLCEREGNIIAHLEHINLASDCQAVCQNHPDCSYFSHYTEDGGKGNCFLHYHCDQVNTNLSGPDNCTALLQVSDKDCAARNDYECLAGPQFPDLDDCTGPMTK